MGATRCPSHHEAEQVHHDAVEGRIGRRASCKAASDRRRPIRRQRLGPWSLSGPRCRPCCHSSFWSSPPPAGARSATPSGRRSNPARRMWTVPAARMKMKREHRVPLCGRALEVLAAARTLRGGSGRAGFTARSGQPVHDDVIVGLPSRAFVGVWPCRLSGIVGQFPIWSRGGPGVQPNRTLWPGERLRAARRRGASADGGLPDDAVSAPPRGAVPEHQRAGTNDVLTSPVPSKLTTKRNPSGMRNLSATFPAFVRVCPAGTTDVVTSPGPKLTTRRSPSGTAVTSPTPRTPYSRYRPARSVGAIRPNRGAYNRSKASAWSLPRADRSQPSWLMNSASLRGGGSAPVLSRRHQSA